MTVNAGKYTSAHGSYGFENTQIYDFSYYECNPPNVFLKVGLSLAMCEIPYMTVGSDGCFLKWWVSPNSHPKCWSFLVGKPHGFVGETQQNRNPPIWFPSKCLFLVQMQVMQVQAIRVVFWPQSHGFSPMLPQPSTPPTHEKGSTFRSCGCSDWNRELKGRKKACVDGGGWPASMIIRDAEENHPFQQTLLGGSSQLGYVVNNHW